MDDEDDGQRLLLFLNVHEDRGRRAVSPPGLRPAGSRQVPAKLEAPRRARPLLHLGFTHLAVGQRIHEGLCDRVVLLVHDAPAKPGIRQVEVELCDPSTRFGLDFTFGSSRSTRGSSASTWTVQSPALKQDLEAPLFVGLALERTAPNFPPNPSVAASGFLPRCTEPSTSTIGSRTWTGPGFPVTSTWSDHQTSPFSRPTRRR